jgi:hypothetical protein
MDVQNKAFLDAAPCSLVDRSRHLEGTHLHLPAQSCSEDVDSNFLRYELI